MNTQPVNDTVRAGKIDILKNTEGFFFAAGCSCLERTPSLLMTTTSPGLRSRINLAPEVKAQLSEEIRYVSLSLPRQRGRIPWGSLTPMRASPEMITNEKGAGQSFRSPDHRINQGFLAVPGE